MKNCVKRRIDISGPALTTGFSLVELMVVVIIIAILTSLSMLMVNRMRYSAAQVTTMNQLKQVGTAALTWGAEKNQGEPMYVTNGTGDYSDEGGLGKTPSKDLTIAAGNPAVLLYNTEDPDQGYITDHRLFFSPLVKTTAPERELYIPREVTAGKYWGTYVWYYPFTKNKSSRQLASNQNVSTIRVVPSFENNFMMMVDYTKHEAVWNKIYLSLFVDGSVRAIGIDETPIRPQ